MEGVIQFLLIYALAFVLYFLPSIVGWSKPNVNGIILLNFFLGWTLIGWVVAMVWAVSDAPAPIAPAAQVAHQDKFDKIRKLKELLNTGAITEEEFNEEKSKLLK